VRNYNAAVSQHDAADITSLLSAWRAGDPAALERLMPIVYDRLRAQARRQLRAERSGHVLQTTALVHEVYLRLIGTQDVDWHDRVHFFALSARLMRRILVDAARARAATKRGGARIHDDAAVDLEQIPAAESSATSLCALDDALRSLAQLDPRRAHVVELRFFGGLSVDETAAVLQVSPQTVMRDWRLARAWLVRELRAEGNALPTER
jgi:RNA polymerase sigma-70 factor, ECF subfamily